MSKPDIKALLKLAAEMRRIGAHENGKAYCDDLNRWAGEIEKHVGDQTPCDAVLHNGPGHQSQTKCHLKGKHDVHEARYGCYDLGMRWRGKEACTGYFDEPKEIDE